MTVLYWVCFVYLVGMCFGTLYRVVDGEFKDCDTCAKFIGKLIGIVIVIALLIGIIYFYLH